jgi:hypothetical protein
VSSEEKSKIMPIESRAETKFNTHWKTMRELRYVKIGGEKRAKEQKSNSTIITYCLKG